MKHLEYIAASLLDMDWHVITDTAERDVAQFDKESILKNGIDPTNLAKIFDHKFYSHRNLGI
ncbi:MAG: hypothetical protein MZV64_15985 [Ignavibacteriales bacterium]|nr:hypothetical protein [Ignavibacteriales bacterium]